MCEKYEHPISFSSDLMPPIMNGQKTQTRRVITPQPKIYPLISRGGFWYGTGSKNRLHYASEDHFKKGVVQDFCPYGNANDLLWVRCAWYHYTSPRNPKNEQAWDPFTKECRWKLSNGTIRDCEPDVSAKGWKHKPGRFMPRWASCLTLKINDIRVERVQEISESDALAEGGPRGYEKYQMGVRDCREWYRLVFDNINKERGYGWDKNPFVWVISFTRC